MTPPRVDEQTPLFSEAELKNLVHNVGPTRPIPEAQDHLVGLREFHGWTLNKLEVLENYLKVYRQVAGGGTFIDAFAGTGRGVSIQGSEQETCDGSSLIAAKSGAFSRLHLIEKDPEAVRVLTTEIQTLPLGQLQKAHIHHDDCNTIIPELLASDECDISKPCFALLDQDSTQLDWDTIEALATWKTYEPPLTLSGRPKMCKVELWILFNSYQAIYRLWPRDRAKYPNSFSPETLDRLFGGRNTWWDLWKDRAPSSALVARFAERLRELDYQYVRSQLIRDPDTDRPQYQMFHATDHPSALSLMRWAKRTTDGYENQHLPGLESNT